MSSWSALNYLKHANGLLQVTDRSEIFTSTASYLGDEPYILFFHQLFFNNMFFFAF